MTRDANAHSAVPFGKYLLRKRLAVGGMAELFLAEEVSTRQQVVIKRILPYLSEEAEFVQMFLDEARIAGQLNHPNVVQLYELGQLNGAIFIAMEFVDGADLRQLFQEEQARGSVVPYAMAARILADVCKGLHYAHHRVGLDGKPLGIIHRDVSPQNVVVGLDGQVKLVDFGIAKAGALMERSKPGVIKGKFLYLSPEQIAQEKLDYRSDLFAVGTMLYEVTVGRSPFVKPTSEAVLYAIRTEEPPPPHLVRQDYPLALSLIVMKCLVKDRERRYQDAQDIERDLEDFLNQQSSPVDSPSVSRYVRAMLGQEPTLRHRASSEDHGRPETGDTSPIARKAKVPEGRRPTPPEVPIALPDTSPIRRALPDGAVLLGRVQPVEPPASPAPANELYRPETALGQEASLSDLHPTAYHPIPAQEGTPDPPPGVRKGQAATAHPIAAPRAHRWPLLWVGGSALFALALAVWPLNSAEPPHISVDAPTIQLGSRAEPGGSVVFQAPPGTRIQAVDQGRWFTPNIRYQLSLGEVNIWYRCPGKNPPANHALEVRSAQKEPQLVRLCQALQ